MLGRALRLTRTFVLDLWKFCRTHDKGCTLLTIYMLPQMQVWPDAACMASSALHHEYQKEVPSKKDMYSYNLHDDVMMTNAAYEEPREIILVGSHVRLSLFRTTFQPWNSIFLSQHFSISQISASANREYPRAYVTPCFVVDAKQYWIEKTED